MQSAALIRTYADADEEQVVALWDAEARPSRKPWNVPRDSIRRKLAVGPELFLVAERDGTVVGTVMAGYDGHRGWIYSLVVDPRFRRRGIARALMAEAERRLRDLGCPKINLQVEVSNRDVVALYEKLGYAVEDRISMGKPLG